MQSTPGASGPQQAEGGNSAARLTVAEAVMTRLWREVLDRASVDPGDDFFALGGGSVRAAQLVTRVREAFAIDIGHTRQLLRELLTRRTMREFTRAVLGFAPRPDEFPDFDGEGVLRLDRELVASTPRCSDGVGRELLLTGATGFIGSHLLERLLGFPEVRIRCLVRAEDVDHARRRIRDAARARVGVGARALSDIARVIPVAGDLGSRRLGLASSDFSALVESTDTIFHIGGSVNFIYPYRDLSPVNIGSVREIAEIACRGGASVHYISSMAVLAGFGAAGVRDRLDEDMPLAFPEYLTVGYVEGKWVAERLLRQLGNHGASVSVYRPMDVSGHAVTGVWDTRMEVCAVIKTIAETGYVPDIDWPLDFVPVDVFANVVAHIAATPRVRGTTTYNVTGPRPARIGLIGERLRARGYQVQTIAYPRWLDAVASLLAAQPGHPMTAFQPLFVERCRNASMSIADMYLDSVFPPFSRHNTERALTGSGLILPPVSDSMIDKHLGWLTAVGFLPPPRPAHQRTS